MNDERDQTMFHAQEFLQSKMERLKTGRLCGIHPEEFQRRIQEFLQWSDHGVEGFAHAESQRRQSVNFCWGHDHNFGDFRLDGEMGTRHIWLLERCLSAFESVPNDLSGLRVLDIGCWTGGVSLLLALMNAEVTAIDEVFKYPECVNFLAKSFGLENLKSERRSVFDLAAPDFPKGFDHIFCFGVIYHVSDPIIALRHCFDSLKIGGTLHLETMAIPQDGSVVEYAGPRERNQRFGWNWFIPSLTAIQRMVEDVGFEIAAVGDGHAERVTQPEDPLGQNRVFVIAKKTREATMTCAGLSKPIGKNVKRWA